MALPPPTDRRVDTLLGSVEIRPIRGREMDLLTRLATRNGSVDLAKRNRLVFQRAVVDPNFTPAQVNDIFERFGPAVQLLLDAIYAISTGVEAPRGRHHHAHRDVAVLNVALERRGDCSPVRRPRGHAARRGTNRRRAGSRRTTARSAGGGSSGDEDGGGSDHPPRLRLWTHPRFGPCSPIMLRVLIGVGA